MNKEITNKLTPRARQTIERAEEAAVLLGHSYVGSEHLLLGILSLTNGIALNALKKKGLDIQALRREVVAQLSGVLPPKESEPPKTRPWSKPEDVPGPACWLRLKDQRMGECMVIAIRLERVVILDLNYEPAVYTWAELNEYSTDRLTWKPCEVTEERTHV